jgi:histidine triad (HIT) family protein
MKTKHDENCIFCKIVKKEIPCDLIYENKEFMVFLDIQPVSNGHLLLIPKNHIVWMQEADDKTISKIFNLTKKMMETLIKKLPCDYVKVFVSGDEVPHFHIHLIPSYVDKKMPEYPRKKYQDGEPSELVKKLTQKL